MDLVDVEIKIDELHILRGCVHNKPGYALATALANVTGVRIELDSRVGSWSVGIGGGMTVTGVLPDAAQKFLKDCNKNMQPFSFTMCFPQAMLPIAAPEPAPQGAPVGSAEWLRNIVNTQVGHPVDNDMLRAIARGIASQIDDGMAVQAPQSWDEWAETSANDKAHHELAFALNLDGTTISRRDAVIAAAAEITRLRALDTLDWHTHEDATPEHGCEYLLDLRIGYGRGDWMGFDTYTLAHRRCRGF